MEVVAWNNGQHHESGAGYGIKLDASDRDQFFDKSWESVLLVLPGGNEVAINIAKDSFWNETCRELISSDIGRWFVSSGNAPWPKGQPPKFELNPIGGNKFALGAGSTG